MPLGPPEDPDRFDTFDECVDALSEDMPEEQAERICGAWENRNMSKHATTETVRKDVEFIAKDGDEQVAAGIVMVPYAVDLQGDWERPDTIQQFAEQFEALEDAGEADGGVMHAVWPDEHIALERNEVVDESTTIGGSDVPEGAWVQEWRFEDEELWSLVEDGILEGYSIGAVDVDWEGPMAQDEVPEEVRVPDDVPDDEPVWELVDGIIREVSTVDIPAVPDAQILETKAEAEKRLADHLGNRDGFIEEAMERGHSEAEAERLWEYLDRAISIDGAGDPGKQSFFARIGKAAFSAFSGSNDGADDDSTSSEPPTQEKEGRTLSTQNRESLFATIDASLDVLQDAGVEHGMTRFTDREDVSFDLSEHSASQWANDDEPDEDDEEDEDGDEAESTTNDATGGDMPDSTMSDNETEDPMEEAPEWAQSLHNDIEENSKRIEELTASNEDESKDADAEADDTEEPPEWAKALTEKVEENAERIDAISEQAGYSDQIGSGGDGDEPESGLDAIGKALS